MKVKYINICIVVLLLLFSFLAIIIDSKLKPEEQMEIVPDSLDLSLLELNKENFLFVCHYYQIQHPEIVYAQAQLESGRFTSRVFQSKNNFLGLYDSRKHSYYEFPHWSDCLKGYKQFVQQKWDGNCDYYAFLENLPYAEDPNYLNKVKQIVKYGKN